MIEYQIRVDGKPVRYNTMLDRETIDAWLWVSEENPEKSVEIVSVRTEVLVNQFNYNQMKKHFNLTPEPHE